MDTEIDGFRITLCNVYGPNNDNPEFYVDVIHQIESLPNDKRIIGGDFNLVLNVDIDKKGGNSTTNTKSQALINDWMDDTELVDIWRFHHPDSRVYSWCRKRPTPLFCRLDFFLVSFGISGKIKSSNISPGFRCDHSLILIDLIPFETKRGKGFWKMNCSHLREKEYVDLIKNTIKTTNEINHEANPHVLWDVIKMAVRGESTDECYGSKRKKSIETEMRSLENKIIDLESQLTGLNDTLIWDDINQCKETLNNLIKKKTQGAIVRSRAQWYQEGERNSLYFLNHKKRNSNLRSINRLELENNTYI